MSETSELMIVAAEKAIHNKFLLGGRATRQIAELALSACAAPDLAAVATDIRLFEVGGRTFIGINNGGRGGWSIEIQSDEGISAATEWDARRRAAIARAKGK